MTAARERLHVVDGDTASTTTTPPAAPAAATTVTGTAASPSAPRSVGPARGRLIAATLILGAPAAAAIWGSATALTEIAVVDRAASPWTLPFCLDVLALGMVVVAVLVPGGGFVRRATPWACYFASAALQVWEVWDEPRRAWGTHALALVAAAIGSHVILDLWSDAVVAADEHHQALAAALADARADHDRALAATRAAADRHHAAAVQDLEDRYDRALAGLRDELTSARETAATASAEAERRARAAESSVAAAADGARATEQARQQLAAEVEELRRRLDRQGAELRTAQSQAAAAAEERADWAIERQGLLAELSAARTAGPRPTARRPAKKTAARTAGPRPSVDVDDLVDVAVDLAASDGRVLASWKTLAAALRSAGHQVNNDVVRTQVLPDARARHATTKDTTTDA